MEHLNLGMILRHRPHGEASTDYSSTSSSRVYSDSEEELDSAHGQTAADDASPARAPHKWKECVVKSNGDVDALKALRRSEAVALRPADTLRRDRFDPNDDSASLRRYWDALFYPEVYMSVFFALRITLLVALPLGILSRHPNVMNKFPAHVVLSLWGIVDCKYTFGEQLAQSIVSYQVSIWMGLWGGLNNIWGLPAHPSAWWCSVIFSCFAVSLLGDVRAKRLLVLQTVMILQMANLPGGTELDYPIRVGRDMIMSTTFSLFQVLVPLRTISSECDKLTAQAWKDTYRILRSATHACWADDPIDRALALAASATEPLQNYLNVIDSKLFFVMYEFWESTLRLELRRERVALLKNMIIHIHALTDTARTLVTNRVLNIVSGEEMNRAPRHASVRDAGAVPASRRRNALPAPNSATSPPSRLEGDEVEEEELDCGDAKHAHPPYGAPRRDHAQDQRAYPTEDGARCRKGGTSALPRSRPVSTDMQMWHLTKGLVHDPVENFFRCLCDVFQGLSAHLNPADVTKHVPFQALRDASVDLQSALNQVHFEVLIKGDKEVDPLRYTSTIFFHLMLIETAQVVLDYGDSMANFDRSRYKSQWVRMWEFFFYDYWRDFWIELPKRLTLATPRDVRIFKDAVKMACAYGVGVMFTEYTDTENVYYFGMAILMGVGWPTVGDTMVASVYRVTGMALACSIAYVAVWHTHTLTQELALSLVGVFIALIFRDRPPYSHTAQYCSMLVITALNSAGTKLVLLARIVSNCFTVMTYYAIVVFLFPTDVLKITFAVEVRAIDTISTRFSRIVSVMHNPLSFDDADHLDAVQTELRLIGDMRSPMWAHLLTLGTWLPKAAGEPTVRGESYPIIHMRNVFSSLRRLASATDVLHSAVSQLFRTRMEGALPTALTMYTGLLPVLRKVDQYGQQILSDFIDAMYRPYEWTPKAATRHLSRFLALSEDLHNVFNDSHRRHTEALREHFRNSVVNRTFAHAARNLMANPSSFAGVPGDVVNSVCGGGGGTGALPRVVLNENASFASRQEVHKVLQDRQQRQQQEGRDQSASDQPVFSAAERVNDLRQPGATSSSVGADPPAAPAMPPSRSASSRTPRSMSNVIDALDDPSKEPVSREVAQRLMSSFAFPSRARTGSVDNPLFVSTEKPEREEPLSTTPTPVTPSPHAPYGKSGVGDADDTADLEAALRPIQELAEEEEYQAFISQTAGNDDDFSLRSDVNKVITILVATDMFFGEAERLVKTMYSINRYARSRSVEPAWHKAQRKEGNNQY